MKRIIVDLDGTLTIDDPNLPYLEKKPNTPLIEKLLGYQASGFEVVVSTSRNMRTYANNIGLINANTIPSMIEWLGRHSIPYNEIHVGKPWCGFEGFYVDDKAIRPSEFIALGYQGVLDLLRREGNSDGGE
jgi:capsule biosynthesis phosphatase